MQYENENKQKAEEERIKQEELLRLKERLDDYKKERDDLDKIIETNVEELVENRKLQEETTIAVQSKLKEIEQMKLEEYTKEIKEQSITAKEMYDNCHKKVKDTLRSTGVGNENAHDFLRLVHEIIPITLDTTDASNQLESYIDTMRELLNRRCQDKYSIKDYFKANDLEKLSPVFIDDLGGKKYGRNTI